MNFYGENFEFYVRKSLFKDVIFFYNNENYTVNSKMI